MPEGGKKKASKKAEQSDQSATDRSSSEVDAAYELMETIVQTGQGGWLEGCIRKMLEMDGEEAEDFMRKMSSNVRAE